MENSDKYLHKLYPFTKLLYVFATAIISVIAPHWGYLYGMFFLLCIFAVTGSKLLPFLKSVCKSVLLLFVLIFVLQSLFRQGTNVLFSIGIFSVKMEGVQYALNLCGILLVIASSFILFFQATDLQDLILAMEKKGISPTISYVVLSTMQMIPQTKKRSEVIMNAQQARGIETKGSLMVRVRAFIPMLAPLILSSFSGMEERALTLEARAFSAPLKKTNIREINKRPIDKYISIFIYLILILAIIGRVTVWH